MEQIDKNTEQKILDAAKLVFTRQGFAAARMDEIATEAGINRALLHYYFRSKQKLFDVIFAENMGNFYATFITILGTDDDIETKVTRLIDKELDMLMENPDLPLFIIAEATRNPQLFMEKMDNIPVKQFFQKFVQLFQDEIALGNIKAINPVHVLMHIMSLCLFPFIGRPVFSHITGANKAVFEEIMLERKKLITDSVIQLFKK